MSNGARPAARLLRWLLPEGDREAVLGELDELYAVRVERTGEREAARWYRRQCRIFVWHLLREGRRRGVRTGMTAFQAAIHDRESKGRGMGMRDVIQEIRFAARRLIRAPVFTLVSVLTVGIAIGAFTSIYGLAEAVLVEKMPYEDPDELAWVWRDYVEADFPRGWLGGPDIVGMREHDDVFAGVVAVRSGELNLTGADGTNPSEVRVQLASHEFFDLLGVRPAMGRGFDEADDVPGAAAVAVLGHRFWQERFGADPGLIGSSILVDGGRTGVPGIAPEGFHFVKHSSLGEPVPADLYLPLRQDVGAQSPGSGMYAGLARIRPGTHPDALESALRSSAQVANDFMAGFDASPVRLWTVGLKEDLIGPVRAAIVALAASAGFLLVILAGNLATLLLGRAAGRQRELGVRMALGAARTRLVASVLAESLLIAAAGGVLGVGLAFLGTDLVVSLAPTNLPRLDAVALDGTVISVGVLVAFGMAVAAALVPALFALRAGVASAIKDGDTRAGGSLRGSRTRDALVSAQLAISLMLLVGAGLTGRAFADLVRQDPGFDPASTLTFTVPLSDAAYPESSDMGAFHDAFRTRVAALPGVTAAGAVTALPLTLETSQQSIEFPNAPGNTGDDQADTPLIDWFRATPDYFEAAGYRLMAGRGFDARDADTTTFSLIIDDVLSERFFPDGSAVGATANIFGLEAAIVGVVDQARLYTVHADDRGQVFIPFQRFPDDVMSYALRAEVDPLSLVPAVRALLQEADPSVPLSDVRTLEQIVQASLGQQRLSLTLILAFAAGALLLAVLGLYGVVSNGVTRRRQEIGVRMALGASGDEVVRLILGQGLRLATLGAILGLIGAYAVAGFMDSVMVGLDARDPLVYAGVAAALVLVAAAASWVPAHRATRIDPVEALTPE